MEVLDFEPSLTAEWERFVCAHPLASYGHLAANFALAEATPGMRNRSLLVREGKNIVAVLPLFEGSHRTLRWLPSRELASGAFFPAGPLTAPSAQGKAETRLVDLLIDAAREKAVAAGADRVSMAHPTVVGGEPASARFAYSPLLHYGYTARPGVGLLLDVSQTVEQLAAARRSGCRQSINKAEGSGATVAPLRDRDQWLACRDINVQTLGDLAFSDSQLAAIWDHFIAAGHATAHAVYKDDTLAAVTVTIHGRGSAYYWIGWSRRPLPVQGASHLGLWSAILAARERGCRFFELGSVDFDNAKSAGISQFKQSFGGIAHQTIAAECDLRPLKSAAVRFAQAVVSSMRHRRSPAAKAPAGAGA